jgi:Enoyl-(Acyl carrier protein) reductase
MSRCGGHGKALVDRSDLVEEVRQEAPPRRVPRNTAPPSEREKVRYQQIVDQALFRSRMKRFETTDEPAAAILFLASDEASYITGVTLPVQAATSAEPRRSDRFRLEIRIEGARDERRAGHSYGNICRTGTRQPTKAHR